MTAIVQDILDALAETPPRPDAAREAVTNAAFVFEKARGLPPSGWPGAVEVAALTADELRQLRDALVAYVERTGTGTFALGKCLDQTLKPFLVATLRRQLDGDPAELYQTMIALDNLGEPVFGSRRSSALDELTNRAIAADYLRSRE
jgi:hypothetical protein